MWRVIDISGEGYILHVKNRNIRIEKHGTPPQSVPFSDIVSIVCHGKGTMFSEAFAEECMANEIPIIFCDEKHLPQGMLLPFYQHSDTFSRINYQVNATLPKKKQAWQQIIKAKVSAQAFVLEKYGIGKANMLKAMADNVLSGDSTNIEAQAARVYFENLFGEEFIRSDDEDCINIALNYGYTILRSLVARAVVSCGLHPSFGLFHSGRINPFCLVDDLMEPLRPLVDRKLCILAMERDSL